MTQASLHKLSLIFKYCLLVNTVHFTIVIYIKIVSSTETKNDGWSMQKYILHGRTYIQTQYTQASG